MRYVSTRGEAPAVGFFDAVLNGLAPDGGLYIPHSWPRDLDRADFRRLTGVVGFPFVAHAVLKAFAGDELTEDETGKLIVEAFFGDPTSADYVPKFDDIAITPLRQDGPGGWLLELFHGPSLAFKDIAMQLIGPLYDFALAKRDRRLSVLCATSGDTGGAAVEALKGRERVDLFVLLPKGRVSDVQRRFMTSSGASNVHPIEVDGDFDDCQAMLKAAFADADFAGRAALSAVNSVNWARIAAQSAYFHLASNTLAAAGDVHFAVPSGNFGDAFSAYVAKKMGAPIGRIVVAVNENDILARALNTGRYERTASKATISPAMDIQAPSNFERLVFDALSRDADRTRGLYQQFAQTGGFDVPREALHYMRTYFSAAALTEDETRMAMSHYAEGGALICPHTAIAWQSVAKLAEADAPQNGPLVTLATAHPAKFPDTVEAATGVRPMLPLHSADLFSRPETFETMAVDAEALKDYIRTHSRAWA